jgi:hypothetical protein
MCARLPFQIPSDRHRAALIAQLFYRAIAAELDHNALN